MSKQERFWAKVDKTPRTGGCWVWTFGTKIQELRRAKNLSQRDLAKKVPMDYTYLSKIENGKMTAPREGVITRLAEILEADLDELLALAGKTPPSVGATLQKSEMARHFFFRHAPDLKEEDWTKILERLKKEPEPS